LQILALPVSGFNFSIRWAGCEQKKSQLLGVFE
jgi:hypothetical protein